MLIAYLHTVFFILLITFPFLLIALLLSLLLFINWKETKKSENKEKNKKIFFKSQNKLKLIGLLLLEKISCEIKEVSAYLKDRLLWKALFVPSRVPRYVSIWFSVHVAYRSAYFIAYWLIYAYLSFICLVVYLFLVVSSFHSVCSLISSLQVFNNIA